MVYSSPTSANGETAGKYFCSYHSRPLNFSPRTLDSTPANNGNPKKTSTDVMLAQNENYAATDSSPSNETIIKYQSYTGRQAEKNRTLTQFGLICKKGSGQDNYACWPNVPV